MANSSVKGLTLAIVALFVVAAGFLFLGGRGHHETAPAAPAHVAAKAAPAAATSIAQAASTGLTDKSSEADVMNAKLPDVAPAAPAAAPATSDTTAAADAPKTDAPADTAATKAPADAPAAKTDVAATPAPDTAKPAADAAGGSLLAAPSALAVDMDKAEAERVMGSDSAPVTIIEYASLTCPHCAHFDKEILPQLKTQFIDTGKVRLIFRDYPLDSFALKAAMMARCADPAKYFNLVDVIFKSQDRWIKAQDPLKALKQLGALAGMDEKYIDACMGNAELESFILNGLNRAQGNYKVNSTPTFIFNSGADKIEGAQDISVFAQKINNLTAGK